MVSADVEKMYRQILITPEQRLFQHIVWREHSSLPLETFELNTVTYGMASDLATRTLRQVGIEARHDLPTASRVIEKDFYVSDLLTGAETTTEAQQIKRDMEKILLKAGFILRKWASNETAILQENSEAMVSIALNAETDLRTLGLLWAPASDTLKFPANTSSTRRVTKRTILSQLARIFNPLGLIASVIITAKLLIQAL